MKSQPAYDPVQQGVSLALDAHRRGFMDDRALDAILAYYDAEGAVDPFPAAEVLAKIGGLTVEQLRALHGAGPTRTPSEIQGKRFGDRLTLLEPIGEGGMGTVHRAYDRVLKRVVAVKRLRVELFEPAARARALSRFEREAMAMARVRHPACVQIFDAGLTKEGEPYLVMEFVAGKSLRAVIEDHHGDAPRGPLDPRQVAAWGVALAEALQACHDVGLVHRDVKPANVLLDAARNPRLTDFGVALDDTAGTKLTVDKAMVGTLAYMAPEQAMGEAVDARSDVYALGVTLYEVLAGQPPFDASSALLLMRQVLSVEAPALRKLAPGAPTDLETIVHKCLSKSPDDRYATAQALALDLRRFLADEPVLAKPVSAGGRLARRLWRARRAVAAAGVLALGGLVLGGVAHVRARAAERARIDAALAAAAVTSDLDAAEQEVLPLVAIAEPEQAERAREALRELRGRRRLRAAEEAFARWKAAIERRVALQAEADALRETIDVRAPFAESPEKQRLLDLDQELASDEQVLAHLIELEGLLAQASLDLPGAEVDALRARVLLARGRAVEDDDPDQAERFFAAADPLDAASGGALRAELARPAVEVTSDPPAQVYFEQYEFDRTKGHMVPRVLGTATTPARWHAPGAGNFRVRVEAPEHLPGNHLIQLTRGDRRTFHLNLPDRASLGPLADEVVFVPGGEARWGPGLRTRGKTEDVLMFRRELAEEVWHSYLVATEVKVPRHPLWSALDGKQAREWPATGMSHDDMGDLMAWFQSELDSASIPYRIAVPTMEQFHRSVRGEFCWPFTWGTTFDASFCISSAGVQADDMLIQRQLEQASVRADESGFGLMFAVGRVGELALPARIVGGSFVVSEAPMRQHLSVGADVHHAYGDISVGVRPVLFRLNNMGGRGKASNRLAAACIAVATIHMQRSNFVEAYRELTRALQAGDDAECRHLRGIVRMKLEDPWGSWWDSSLVYERTGGSFALVNRAVALRARGVLDQALRDLTSALETSPEIPEAWLVRARVHIDQGELDRARADLERAVALDAKHPVVAETRRRLDNALDAAGR